MDGVKTPSSAHAQANSGAPKEPVWGDYVAPTAHAVLDGVAIAGCVVPALAPIGMAAKAGDACLYLAQGDTWSAGVATAEILPLMKWGRILGEAGELGLKWLPKAGRWARPLMEAASRVVRPVGESLNGAGKVAKGLAAGHPGMEAAATLATHYARPALQGAVRVTVMKQIKPIAHDYLPPDHHGEWMLETANDPALRYGLTLEHAALGMPGKVGEPGDGLELTREERDRSTGRYLDSVTEMRQNVLGKLATSPTPSQTGPSPAEPVAIDDGVDGLKAMQRTLIKQLSADSTSTPQAAPEPTAKPTTQTPATVPAPPSSAADASINEMRAMLQQQLSGSTQTPR